MEKEAILHFTSKHIETLFGINRKVLLYWRKIGVLSPELIQKSKGGHYRYSFADLVVIKTIKKLQQCGISTFKIKKVVEKLKTQYPDLQSPLSEKSLHVVGKEVLVAEKKSEYNPLTEQYSFIMAEETKADVKKLTLEKFNIPESVMRVRASRR